jgi:D-sedoheptulose 7-phosphate isomerase
MSFNTYLAESVSIISKTATYLQEEKIENAITALVVALNNKKPILVCGNGGSSADSMHIAGELVGKFMRERRALNCISLSSNPSILTAWSNDYSYDTVFSRQVEGLGSDGGVLWGISTSGNSLNVILALKKAKEIGMITIGMTGAGGKMAEYCDIILDVPSNSTPLIQQVHVCIYHYICQMIEDRI